MIKGLRLQDIVHVFNTESMRDVLLPLIKRQGDIIKILKAKEVKITGQPGVILNENFTIACSRNAIQILELQKEGKNKTTTEEFLRGNKLKTGITLA